MPFSIAAGTILSVQHDDIHILHAEITINERLVFLYFCPKNHTMKHTYYPQGTCSQVIEFEIVDGKIHNVQFYGGCDGNTQGVGRLVEGMDAEEVVQRLEGIRCGFKPTSCPDQLAKAIKAALNSEK